MTSKGSGAANEFEISSGDAAGRAALEKLGLSYGAEAEESIASKKTALYSSLKSLASSNADLQAALQNINIPMKDASGNVISVSADSLTDEQVKALTDDNIVKIVSELQRNTTIPDDLKADLEKWESSAGELVKDMRRFAETKKTAAADAEIELNGATYTSTSNSFNINGLTLTVNSTTAPGEEVTITTQDDTDGIYDMIKNFFKEYNTMINQMDKLYNADSAKGYEPLTDEEKEAMSDSAIEEWIP